MSFARATDGTALYYEVNGRGEDVLVLIAGQSNNHHWWDVPRQDFDAVLGCTSPGSPHGVERGAAIGRDARAWIIPGARHAYFEEFRTVASPMAGDFLTGP